jgi:hypothetical protein
MNMRRRLAISLATAALLGARTGPALGADTITVSAQVNAAAPCLIGPPETIDFGSNLFTANDADESYSSRQVIFTSCSGLPEQVFGRATSAENSDGSAVWTLGPGRQRCPAFGLNQYLLEVSATGGETRDGDIRTLSAVDQQIELLEPGADGAHRGVMLIMPCVGSDGAGETMSFQIIYSATF